MPVVFASIVAALISYLVGRLLLKILGKAAVPLVNPLVEELSKSSAALIWPQVGFVFVHLGFGLIESVKEFSRPSGVTAAVLSIITHSFFGGLTAFVYRFTGSFMAAVSAAGLVHMLYNTFIYDLTQKSRKG